MRRLHDGIQLPVEFWEGCLQRFDHREVQAAQSSLIGGALRGRQPATSRRLISRLIECAQNNMHANVAHDTFMEL